MRSGKRGMEIAAVLTCPAGFRTIGYGHLCAQDHPPITQDEAEAYLAQDLVKALSATLRYCPVLATAPNSDWQPSSTSRSTSARVGSRHPRCVGGSISRIGPAPRRSCAGGLTAVDEFCQGWSRDDKLRYLVCARNINLIALNPSSALDIQPCRGDLGAFLAVLYYIIVIAEKCQQMLYLA